MGHHRCCASPTRIAELSVAAGVPQAEALAELARTQRMLQWESGTFLVLLLTLSGALFWYYRRDMQRARGTQAFFAALTHELRTPLTSVRLQTEAIAAGEPTQELIERLLADTHRLESQIDKTLELARIEGGGALAEQAIRLDPWLERVLRGIVAQPKAKAPQLRVAHGAGSAAGARRHRRAAADPAQPGRELAAPWRSRARSTSTCRRAARATAWSCIIAMTAAASRATRRSLGRLFLRGGASRGTGVGLYLVRVLMERMGGNVQLRACRGGGFAATLRFQRSTAEAGMAESAACCWWKTTPMSPARWPRA